MSDIFATKKGPTCWSMRLAACLMYCPMRNWKSWPAAMKRGAEWRPASSAALAALEQKGTVRFLGHRNFGPELFQCFADADVLVVPSRTEGTPRVLVEARAFGCPVIGTSVGGIPTSIADGVDGLLVLPEDSTALAEAILRLAGDPQLRERLIKPVSQERTASTVEAFAAGIAGRSRRIGSPKGDSPRLLRGLRRKGNSPRSAPSPSPLASRP